MPDLSERKKLITSHYITHWGVLLEIYPRGGSNTPEIAVLEFLPKYGRSTYKFATNGLSQRVVGQGKSRNRVEIYTSSQSRAQWIIELLARLVQHSLKHRERIFEFTPVSVGQAIDGNGSPFNLLLIVPPGTEEPETLGAPRPAAD